jgi:hypothetical protein
MSLYLTVRSFSWTRLAATAALFAFGTFLHVYEGLTLMFIAAGTLFLCWRKGLPSASALRIGAACAAAAGTTVLLLALVYRMSGAAAPEWRGLNVLPSILLLGYPLALAIVAWNWTRFWSDAGIDEAFLAGWALGCFALIFAAPFFPYPDRGTMTLQIPLFLMAGIIVFRTRPRVGPAGALLAVLLLGSTPVWMAKTWVERTTFKTHETHKWMSPDHVAMAAALRDAGRAEDVLLAGEVPLRWLAPEYRGRHYAGHFFLTERYDRKQRQLREFYQGMDASARTAFMASQGITLVYVDADQQADLTGVPGLRPLDSRPFGTLFRFTADAAVGVEQAP